MPLATSIKDKLFIGFQYLVPQHLLSHLVGWIAETRIQWIKNLFISKFIKQFDVNMSEAERQTPEAFENFNDFFTRELKPGMRAIDDSPNSIACPADGAISQLGEIDNGRIFQAKGPRLFTGRVARRRQRAHRAVYRWPFCDDLSVP